ncbi:MAG: transposase [Deltaproteobacteria bacterium]|nr:transposase [Deltaproteobacteria bacterium]
MDPRARASGVRALAALAAASGRRSEGIWDWYRHRISTAPPEGPGTGIRALIRRACGFRNIGILRRMIPAVRGFSPQRLSAPGQPVRPASGIRISPGHSAGGDGAGTAAFDRSHAEESCLFQCMCALSQEHEASLR